MDQFMRASGYLLLSPVPQSYVETRAGPFSDAITECAAASKNGIGFLDGLVLGVARPSGYMKQIGVYNGHKRKHALKYQAVTTPDGMILHEYGPVEGKRYDWFMFS